MNPEKLALRFEPVQMAHAITEQRGPMTVGTVIWPIRVLRNLIFPHKFIAKPTNVNIEMHFRISLLGFPGKFDGSLYQHIERLPPHHVADPLLDVLRAPLIEVFAQVVLFQSTTLACNQSEAGVRDKDPHDGRYLSQGIQDRSTALQPAG